VHLLRVFLYGSYKAPREVTWLTGLVLFALVLAFALSGYLLPWDQKAYWATTVTVNVARSGPFGEYVAGLLQGGATLGALTLGRWYAAHVLLLPAALLVFIVAHIALMRRHGISGPVTPQPGPPTPFYPWHVIKDTLMMAAVFAALLTVAVMWPAPLDEIANPADASYIPRPEWYFLPLFELLKYFPGPWEPVATLVLPGLVLGFLAALPFLDRGGDRRPLARGRRVLGIAMAAIVTATVALTLMGLGDLPPRYDATDWGPRSVVGHLIVSTPESPCVTCHVTGGPAADLAVTRVTRDEEWLLAHLSDPTSLAPGTHFETAPPALGRFQAQAVVAYFRRVRGGGTVPTLAPTDQVAVTTFASTCVACHRIAGEGGTAGPDLSAVGTRRDADSIRRVILDPASEFPGTVMPKFGSRLNQEQVDAVVDYLSRRR
jgi:ubiquinol-cytochrome c reductase cytochrome b subunit